MTIKTLITVAALLIAAGAVTAQRGESKSLLDIAQVLVESNHYFDEDISYNYETGATQQEYKALNFTQPVLSPSFTDKYIKDNTDFELIESSGDFTRRVYRLCRSGLVMTIDDSFYDSNHHRLESVKMEKLSGAMRRANKYLMLCK